MALMYGTALVFAWLYTLKARRRVDVHTLALAAATGYFAPLLTGRDLHGQALHAGVYAVGTLVVLALCLSAVIRDRRPEAESRPLSPRLALYRRNYARVLVVLTVLLGLTVLVWSGGTILTVHKTDVVGVPHWVLPMWRISGTLLLLLGVATRHRAYMVIGGIHVAFVFLASDRTNVAMAGGALLLLYGLQGADLRALLRPRILGLFAILLVAVVWGSTAFSGLRVWADRDLNSAMNHVRTADYAGQLTSSEPFLTQLILNQVLMDGYQLPAGYLWSGLLQWTPSVRALGFESGHFNTEMQRDLFPGVTTYRMAYNYWAEALATGGWLMLALFLLLFLLGLHILDAVLSRSRSPLVVTTVAYSGAYWAVYIHRNSLLTSLAFQRHIFYFVLGAAAVTLLSTRAKRATLRDLSSGARDHAAKL